MNCPNCHNQIRPDAKFCPHCGHKLVAVAPPPGAPEPPESPSAAPAAPPAEPMSMVAEVELP